MPIAANDCAPYASTVLFEVHNVEEVDLVAVRQLVIGLIRDMREGDVRRGTIIDRTVSRPPAVVMEEDISFGVVHVVERRRPGWYLGEDAEDRLNHLVVLAASGRILSVTSTDGGLRDRVIAALRGSDAVAVAGLRPLGRDEMERAFVGSEVKTVWLSATHRRVAVKPDAKVLSGMELESAFDPLDDQTYAFTSIRTPSLGDRRIVGANPSKSRLWIGPSRTWADFTGQIASIFRRIEQVRADAATAWSTLPVLARPSASMEGIGQPYDMTTIVPEIVSVDGAGDDDDGWRAEFADAARFEILEGGEGTDFRAHIWWGDDPCGTIAYRFEQDNDGVKLSATVEEWDAGLPHSDTIRKFCVEGKNLTVYYDTGHTFARGAFYGTQFRDQPFENWSWTALDGYRVKAEKPLIGKALNIEGMGNEADNSLFGYMVKRWGIVEGQPGPSGWLACDDGSMESADFIHLDGEGRTLSLIHVKGSGTASATRGVSVTDYEIVVGQAIKNLRHLDRGLLIEKLEAGTDHQIATATWFDGVRRPNRDDFLDALRAVVDSYRRRVIVFQPRVRRTEHAALRARIDAGQDDANIRRLKQLDTLLLAARADCYKLGADFEVLAHDDS